MVSNLTVSQGHAVGKLLAVAYAEGFHAGRASGRFWPSRGGEVGDGHNDPFFDPQDMRLRA